MLSEFAYRGIDPAGNSARGSITALDKTAAISQLRLRGLTVVALSEKRSGVSGKSLWKRSLGEQEIYNVMRELSTLLRSGITIDRSLDLLIQTAKNIELREILSRALADIKTGKGVARALDNTERFDSFIINMIQVGETVGELQSAFENVAQYMHFQIQFKSEIKNALVYPVFLIFASILSFVVIFNFIVPRFFSIFGTNKASLPAAAKILYAISGWFSLTNLVILSITVVVLIVAKPWYGNYIKLPSIYSISTRIPVIRTLLLHLDLSRFFYAMYSMLQGGVEFIVALNLSASMIQGERLKGPLTLCIGQIKEGKKIADVFSQVELLPDIVHPMITVGEESGSLKEIFLELYRMFDERLKNSIKRLVILLEPAIIIIMGLIVGFIVITLILTVMSVSSIKL
jgi:general secretion pathway protein F